MADPYSTTYSEVELSDIEAMAKELVSQVKTIRETITRHGGDTMVAPILGAFRGQMCGLLNDKEYRALCAIIIALRKPEPPPRLAAVA